MNQEKGEEQKSLFEKRDGEKVWKICYQCRGKCKRVVGEIERYCDSSD